MKVRYHLQKGPNFMKWQFTDNTSTWYLEPKENLIKLTSCILYNNRKLAEKIYTGDNKDVCAWINFQKYDLSPEPTVFSNHIKYNPKVLPYWHTADGKNIDGLFVEELFLTEKGVFAR